MRLGEVIGSAVCTITVEPIKKNKFKLVKLIGPKDNQARGYSMVEDPLGIGYGEKVLISEDETTIAEMYDGKMDIPIRFCIVAKVDEVNITG